MSICDLKVGQHGTIDSLSGEDKLIKRLLSLGCTKGTDVLLKNTAPLGDPLVVNFRGFNLAIRKKDAERIFIK
jgi:ferrous iron transport protein A